MMGSYFRMFTDFVASYTLSLTESVQTTHYVHSQKYEHGWSMERRS